tara:strand:+ start:681 stop:1055 length:375 start_codon:yes stop_codon:yes gene_type:complete
MYKVRNKELKMQTQIENLLETIKTDYFNWTSRNGTRELSEVNKKMIAEFNEELGYKEGNKYIKITNKNGGSVWGFVVATDNHKKFKKGDILKAAGFNSPATNAARGNIIDGGYTVQWTGPLYLV